MLTNYDQRMSQSAQHSEDKSSTPLNNTYNNPDNLSPDIYHIAFEHGTERAHTSPLNNEKNSGIYSCAVCNLELFSSNTKYDSGTGWPSFYDAIEGAVETSTDYKAFFPRTEVHCSRCKAHLGHVFKDGPAPTKKRYCMNGTVLNFQQSNVE